MTILIGSGTLEKSNFMIVMAMKESYSPKLTKVGC